MNKMMRYAKKHGNVMHSNEKKVGNRNCLWEGPDIELSKTSKQAIEICSKN